MYYPGPCRPGEDLISILSVMGHGLQSTSSSIYGIFQARVLEWGAIAFSEMGLEMPKLLLVDSQYEESYVLREHV